MSYNFWGMVSNCPRCQIVLGVKLSVVSNCPRCQIVRGVKLSECQIVRGVKLSECQIVLVSNFPWCQIVRGVKLSYNPADTVEKSHIGPVAPKEQVISGQVDSYGPALIAILSSPHTHGAKILFKNQFLHQD